MEIATIIGLFILHYIGDFLLQNEYMATNKSKSLAALTLHVAIYTFTLFGGVVLMNVANYKPTYSFLWFGLLTFTFHFITDFISSKINANLYQKKLYYGIPGFFPMLGLDQLLHYIQIIVCYNILIS